MNCVNNDQRGVGGRSIQADWKLTGIKLVLANWSEAGPVFRSFQLPSQRYFCIVPKHSI